VEEVVSAYQEQEPGEQSEYMPLEGHRTHAEAAAVVVESDFGSTSTLSWTLILVGIGSEELEWNR
jgi:hypothetical protein